MKGILNSLRFQLFAVLLLLAVLVAGASFQNIRTLNLLAEIEGSQELASAQRSQTYLLSSLARRLLNADTEITAQSIAQTIQDSIANVQQDLDELRSDAVVTDNPEIPPLMETVDLQWNNYIRLLEQFIQGDEDTRTALIVQIESSSVTVFTLTDRLNNAIEEIAALQSQVVRQISVVQGVILALTLAITIFIILRAIQAINRLRTTVRHYSEGQTLVRASTGTLNEIAAVGQVFNRMADELNATIEGLKQREITLQDLNQSLEQRVAERTADLKTARDEALAAKRIADENSRLKSEFLSMMSHELRTPMNAIEGFTGIMLKRMAGVDYNEKSERYLLKIQSNSRRLLGLINDFLDLSRIESGRLELAYLPMSPRDMTQKWRENLSVLADNKGLEFDANVDPNLPETMYGDEESISKIAINLVGNAIKFTETGSVKVSLHKLGDQMALEVRDTGIGIPAHAREFIFDEFRQVDMTSKRKHGGTGLGLAIVQKLAREMGGMVTLQSEVGYGSTFTVVLPIHTEIQMA